MSKRYRRASTSGRPQRRQNKHSISPGARGRVGAAAHRRVRGEPASTDRLGISGIVCFPSYDGCHLHVDVLLRDDSRVARAQKGVEDWKPSGVKGSGLGGMAASANGRPIHRPSRARAGGMEAVRAGSTPTTDAESFRAHAVCRTRRRPPRRRGRRRPDGATRIQRVADVPRLGERTTARPARRKDCSSGFAMREPVNARASNPTPRRSSPRPEDRSDHRYRRAIGPIH